MSKLLAIDPGMITGVAIKLDGKYQTCTVLTSSELWEIVKSVKWDAVIFETFQTSGRISKYGLGTVELVGGIRALCWMLDLKPNPQMPQCRLPYLMRARAKLKGDRHMDHEEDALAHMLAWESSNATST